jgi:aminoglycoside phosphotransferase (APT) family kinase protein
VRWTVEKLVRLIDAGAFDSIELADVERVATWAVSAPVLRAIEDGPRLVHGDLSADHVFATADGPKVVGWRRPVIGPPGLDLVEQSCGAEPAVTGIAWFLRLRWAAIAQVEPWAAAAVAELRRPS